MAAGEVGKKGLERARGERESHLRFLPGVGLGWAALGSLGGGPPAGVRPSRALSTSKLMLEGPFCQTRTHIKASALGFRSRALGVERRAASTISADSVVIGKGRRLRT